MNTPVPVYSQCSALASFGPPLQNKRLEISNIEPDPQWTRNKKHTENSKYCKAGAEIPVGTGR